MRQRGDPLLRFASPLKAWAHRVPVAGLAALAVALMIFAKADAVLLERARVVVTDALTPVLAALATPTARLTRAIDNFSRYADLPGEIARLQEERDKLLQWQAIARRLEAENHELHRLLNLALDPRLGYVTARVVGDTGGTFFRSLIVAAGAREGVRKGQPAVAGEGLAGRVVEVGQRSARLLLITDINSRVPVIVERSRERAVLAGVNSDRPQLLYLSADADVVLGDRVVTSGHSDIFVPGLPVGVVAGVAEGIVEVEPFVDWERMEFVRLVDYELPRVLLAPVGEDGAGEPR